MQIAQSFSIGGIFILIKVKCRTKYLVCKNNFADTDLVVAEERNIYLQFSYTLNLYPIISPLTAK